MEQKPSEVTPWSQSIPVFQALMIIMFVALGFGTWVHNEIIKTNDALVATPYGIASLAIQGVQELVAGGNKSSITFRVGVSALPWLAQSFTAPSGKFITGVQIALVRRANPSYPITVSLHSSLTGPALTSTTITPVNLSDKYLDPTWVSVNFPASVQVVGGEALYLRLSSAVSDDVNYYNWAVESGNTYKNGMFYSMASQQPNRDALLKVRISDSSAIPNSPPVVSNVNPSVPDANPVLFGYQIGAGRNITYSGSASDSDGDSLSWSWLYSKDDAPLVVVSSGIGTVSDVVFSYPTSEVGSEYEWVTRVSDGTETIEKSLLVDVVSDLQNPSHAGENSLTLYANKDNMIAQAHRFNNWGVFEFTWAKRGNGIARGITGFDLPPVPVQKITKARFIMSVMKESNELRGIPNEVFPIWDEWTEGNQRFDKHGTNLNVPGYGEGSTWSCASDINIANGKSECGASASWDGVVGAIPTITPTDTVMHKAGDTQTEWDVTKDVITALSSGKNKIGWVVNKANETSGSLRWYTREGALHYGNYLLTPRLIIETNSPFTAPIVSLSSLKSSLYSGEQNTLLVWDVKGATSCSASGGWSGTKSFSGTETVSPIADATYTLTCTGPDGSASHTVMVTVRTDI